MGFGFPRENEFDGLILTAANAEGIDPAWLKSVIAEESGFDPGAYHYDLAYEQKHGLAPDPLHHSSRGIAQIEGSTWEAMGAPGGMGDDATHTGGPYDVNLAIPAQAHILANNLRIAGGRMDVATAAYNEGWSTIRPGDAPRTGDGTFVDQAYVDRVISHFYPVYSAEGVTAPVVSDDAGSAPVEGIGLALGLAAVALAAYLFFR